MPKAKSKIQITNRRASYDYEFLETYDAGIVLVGTEIKSLRLGKASLADAFCYFVNGELYVKGMNISTYFWGSWNSHEPARDRKLLLTKRELRHLQQAVKQKGRARRSLTNARPSRKKTCAARWNAVKGDMPKKRMPIIAELPAPETIDEEALAASLRDGSVDLVCVLGPTASGKTRYAVSLARRLGAEIISADSRQVYRGMDIGTGKDLSEYGDVPYHLIDIQPAGAKYNVYEFQKDFVKAYQDIRSRGRVPLLCGGTGLYIEAATCGYDFDKRYPTVDPALFPHNTFYIGTLVDRATRNARIDARLDARLAEGLVDEVSGLLDAGVPAETLIYYGLEYKFVTQHVLGILSYDEMRTLLANAIHQFAKRQMTWFRGMERDGIVIHWTEP